MPGMKVRKHRNELADKKMADAFFWEDLFTRVSHGLSIQEYAKTRDVPYKRMMARIKDDEALSKGLDEAKHARAWGYFEDVDRVTDLVEDGKIDPNAGRVVLQSRQWQAKMMDRNTFGDRQQVDMKVQDVTQEHLDAVRRMSAPEVVEGEVIKDENDA